MMNNKEAIEILKEQINILEVNYNVRRSNPPRLSTKLPRSKRLFLALELAIKSLNKEA